eukprot:TRINITY_DN751_c0_g1_i1.p1 TRINITY_DN751_c0_g1~~TRINITY_DN751_c0_g1_i1.p1  ORF type:complete len:1825 (-),score=361.56 TRINITY_DN751_c0_g1_i1:2120-7570(-)
MSTFNLNIPKLGRSCRLRSLDIKNTIVGFLSRTSVTMEFENEENIDTEGELIFPMPDGASLCGYAIDIDGTLVEGVIVEKEKARVTFEAEARKEVSHRPTASIAEHVVGNVFKTRVYPLLKLSRRLIRVSYVEELESTSSSHTEFSLPITTNRTLDRFSFTSNIQIELEDVPALYNKRRPPTIVLDGTNANGDTFDEISSQRVSTSYSSVLNAIIVSKFCYRHEKHNCDLSKGVKITIPNGGTQKYIIERDPESGDVFVAVNDSSFRSIPQSPPSDQSSEIRIGVLWDSSSSRAKIDHQPEFNLIRAVTSKHTKCILDIYVFSIEVSEMRSFEVRYGECSAVQDYLQNQVVYFGGSNLQAAPFGKFPQHELSREGYAYLMLFTDGFHTMGPEPLPKEIEAPVYVISSGQLVNTSLGKILARRSGGAFFELSSSTSASSIASSIGTAPLSFLNAIKEDALVGDIFPSIPTSVTKANSFRLAAKIPSSKLKRTEPTATTLTLNYGFGTTTAKSVPLELIVPPLDFLSNTGLVSRFWAQRQVDELGLFPEIAENERLIFEVGKRFGIVTSNASLIVLEELDQYLKYDIEPPNELPNIKRDWLRLKRQMRDAETEKSEEKILHVLDLWKRRVAWWNEDMACPETTQRVWLHHSVFGQGVDPVETLMSDEAMRVDNIDTGMNSMLFDSNEPFQPATEALIGGVKNRASSPTNTAEEPRYQSLHLDFFGSTTTPSASAGLDRLFIAADRPRGRFMDKEFQKDQDDDSRRKRDDGDAKKKRKTKKKETHEERKEERKKSELSRSRSRSPSRSRALEEPMPEPMAALDMFFGDAAPAPAGLMGFGALKMDEAAGFGGDFDGDLAVSEESEALPMEPAPVEDQPDIPKEYSPLGGKYLMPEKPAMASPAKPAAPVSMRRQAQPPPPPQALQQQQQQQMQYQPQAQPVNGLGMPPLQPSAFPMGAAYSMAATSASTPMYPMAPIAPSQAAPYPMSAPPSMAPAPAPYPMSAPPSTAPVPAPAAARAPVPTMSRAPSMPPPPPAGPSTASAKPMPKAPPRLEKAAAPVSRVSAVESLEREAREVSALMQDMKVLVQEQSQSLDSIESNILTSKDSVSSGEQELMMARSRRSGVAAPSKVLNSISSSVSSLFGSLVGSKQKSVGPESGAAAASTKHAAPPEEATIASDGILGHGRGGFASAGMSGRGRGGFGLGRGGAASAGIRSSTREERKPMPHAAAARDEWAEEKKEENARVSSFSVSGKKQSSHLLFSDEEDDFASGGEFFESQEKLSLLQETLTDSRSVSMNIPAPIIVSQEIEQPPDFSEMFDKVGLRRSFVIEADRPIVLQDAEPFSTFQPAVNEIDEEENGEFIPVYASDVVGQSWKHWRGRQCQTWREFEQRHFCTSAGGVFMERWNRIRFDINQNRIQSQFEGIELESLSDVHLAEVINQVRKFGASRHKPKFSINMNDSKRLQGLSVSFPSTMSSFSRSVRAASVISVAPNSAFYVESALWGLSMTADETELLSVVSCLTELDLNNAQHLRIAMFLLAELHAKRNDTSQLKYVNLMVELARLIAKWRPEEPQSHRDLALALAMSANAVTDNLRRARHDGGSRDSEKRKRMDTAEAEEMKRVANMYLEALDILQNNVILKKWDARFNQVEVVATNDMNWVLAHANRNFSHFQQSIGSMEKLRSKVDSRLSEAPLSSDLRVVISWDTDMTDVELHVVEPSGEKCCPMRNKTSSGGMLSRNFTHGYGPVEYLLKRAPSGTYKVMVNLFHSLPLQSGTTVRISIYTDFCSAASESSIHRVVLLKQLREVVEVAEIVVNQSS